MPRKCAAQVRRSSILAATGMNAIGRRSINTSRLSTTILSKSFVRKPFVKLLEQTSPRDQLLTRFLWSRSTHPPAENMSPRTSIEEFQVLVKRSYRIVALCGAGLSASSGLPTFRGSGGMWRNHEPESLATPEAFKRDPALVWLFYAWRRHLCLNAEPNNGHYALAELARKKPNFLCLTQNVDGKLQSTFPSPPVPSVGPSRVELHSFTSGLSTRAGHPASQLRTLHGSILDLKCSGDRCAYVDKDNRSDPLCPALQAASAVDTAPGDQSGKMPLLDPAVPVPKIDVKDLPHCPNCKTHLLRPGVVWFGEALDSEMLAETAAWIEQGPVDLMLVVGTAAVVWPAAGYVEDLRKKGAVVAVINPDPDAAAGLEPEDFFFQGDAAETLPHLFAKVKDFQMPS